MMIDVVYCVKNKPPRFVHKVAKNLTWNSLILFWMVGKPRFPDQGAENIIITKYEVNANDENGRFS